MPTSSTSPWLMMIMPWRYNTPWRRFCGTGALVCFVLNMTIWIVGGGPLTYLAFPLIVVLFGLFTVDVVIGFIDQRRFRREMKTMNLWSQVLDGKVRIEDLTPEQQEEIAVQRAMIYTKRS
jgi:hypothetical protein